MSTIVAWLRRWPLVSYFVLANAICAAAFFSNFITPLQAFSPIWLIGICSPSIAGLLISGIMGGWPSLRRLLAGYTRWRLG